MLSKLKSQLEELRSKVVFLDSVKKHLEVSTIPKTKCYFYSMSNHLVLLTFDWVWFVQILSMEQWGLQVSLLPSLAVSGADSLDLQSAEDPSVLSFGSSKGKSTLQSGSPLGLMAYLYARYY